MLARRKPLLAATVAAALLVVLGLWTAARRLDGERVRVSFREAVARATGGSLETGAVEVALGLPPRVVAESLDLVTRFATARIARCELEMSLLSLLTSDTPRILRVRLHDLDVVVGPPSRASSTDDPPHRPPEGSTTIAPALPAGVRVSDVRIHRSGSGIDDDSPPFATIERAALTTTRDGRGTLRGRGALDDRAVELRGGFGPLASWNDRDGRIDFDLAGSIENVGELDVTGTLERRGERPSPHIEAKIRAKHLDLPGPLTSRGDEERPKLFHDHPLPPFPLTGASARIELSSATLRIGRALLRDVDVVGELDDRSLRLDPLRARSGGGEVVGAAEIDGTQSPPAVSLRLSGAGVALSGIIEDSGSPELLRGGRARFETDLRARGTSPASIASTLDGDVRLLMGEARARTTAFDRLTLGPRKLVGKLTGETRRWTKIDCAAATLAIDDGNVTPEVLLVDTPRTTLVGRGRIDLGAESIALEIAPVAKLSDPGIGVPVRVLGPLARPSVDADEVGAARTLGGLLSVADFPRAAVEKLEGLGAERNACLDLAAGREPIGPSGIVAETRAVGESIAGEIADGARKLRDGVGGLFD